MKTVCFAPGGELYDIAVESVPDHATGGRKIVSDGRTYHRLSSTRELALRKDKDAWDAAAVYGGLKCGMTAEGLTANSRDFTPHADGGTAHTNELYSIADTVSAMRGGALAEQLPGTLVEAETIDTNLEAIERTRTLDDNLTPAQRRRLEREGASVGVQTITEKVKPYADPKFWAAFIMLDGVD